MQKPRKLFLSCLGTSSYTPTVYEALGGREDELPQSERTAFIQIARLRALEARGDRPVAVRVLTTDEARKRNVDMMPPERPTVRPPDRLPAAYPGLGVALKELGYDPDKSLPRIEEGASETELWQIFETIMDAIEEGDQVYLDLTHGFRSLSVVLLTALQFALRAKNATLQEVSYGAFEAARDKSAPVAPTFDLTPFFVLNDWTDAVAVFRASRDLRPLARLAKRASDQVKKRKRQERPETLIQLASKLQAIARVLAETRLYDVAEAASAARLALLASSADVQEHLETKPIGTLLQDIARELSPLTGGASDGWQVVRAGYAATHWLLAGYNLHAAATMARETTVAAIAVWYAEAEGQPISHKALDRVWGALLQTPEKVQIEYLGEARPVWEALVGRIGAAPLSELRRVVRPFAEARNALDHAFTGDNDPSDPAAVMTRGLTSLSLVAHKVLGIPLA